MLKAWWEDLGSVGTLSLWTLLAVNPSKAQTGWERWVAGRRDGDSHEGPWLYSWIALSPGEDPPCPREQAREVL